MNDYAGLVTRAIAFSVDAAIINLAAAIVAVVVGLGVSVLDPPDVVVAAAVAVGGVAYVLWSVAYFADVLVHDGTDARVARDGYPGRLRKG